MPVDFAKWYWLADDGRVFSAERGIVVDDQDADYQAFAAAQTAATWPRDANGDQTETSLLEALEPFGFGISLVSYASQRRWLKEVGGITLGGVPISTDDRSKQMILGARVAAMANENFTTTWVAADGSLHQMNAALLTAISDAVLEHVRSVFATYAEVLAAIDNGEITSKAQIDAAFA
jgi:hypothetical protein